MLLGAALALGACAGAPTQEMSDARQALGAARDADAPRHAPGAYGQAVAHMEAAATSLQDGAYEVARERALAARSAAIDARRVAAAIGDAVRALGQAGGEGAARADAARLLEQARRAAARGDAEAAIDLAGRAVRRAAVAE
jgi:hypothetical protein